MGLSISQAGQETGISTDTLRYYERIGLLGPVARNGGGQRRYSTTDVARLRFIRRAQAMDFSLEEIAQLLALRDQPGDVRASVREMTETRLAAIEQRIGSLMQLRDELTQLVSACQASDGDCPIIARMDNRQGPVGAAS